MEGVVSLQVRNFSPTLYYDIQLENLRPCRLNSATHHARSAIGFDASVNPIVAGRVACLSEYAASNLAK